MPKNRTLRTLLIFLLGFSILTTAGCRGCRDNKELSKEEKKKAEEAKKEREKPSFEIEPLITFPGQYQEPARRNRIKSGHWVNADFRILANKFDSRGELTASSMTGNKPVPVENTDYFSATSRPYSVAKGELKNLSTNIYVPRRKRGVSAFFNFGLSRSSGASILHADGVPLMRPFQYHMVVLTNRADRYGYLNVIDSVTLPHSELATSRVPSFYNVVRTNPSEDPIALPRQSLYWTTIAYVIWDDLDVSQLDADQQQALVDWIHYGGQLILSGPDCLENLTNSFLAEFLPAKVKSSRNLSAQDFADINQFWEVKDSKLMTSRKIVVNDAAPIIGVDFDPHPAATFVNDTGKIAIERQVGRGRIVATSFSMNSKPIINWPSFRSFFNSVILRRPAREFGNTNDGILAFKWIDDATSIFDPLIGTTLRYLSRDLVDSTDTLNRLAGTPPDANVSPFMVSGLSYENLNYQSYDNELYRTKNAAHGDLRNLEDHWHYGGFQHDECSGTAGWNDDSGISVAARDTLRRAAGISPPSSGFVLKMLSIYLLILVPVNWLVFRAIGRVEWAWIAAPVIAIAGALMVAKMASLDIGFVRSNSQVACLEVYADYPRAHVAQYSALYTSLSTGYQLELDNPTAQSLPLGEPNKKWKEIQITPVTLRQTLKNRLEGFQVQSNSTGMLHTEMMLDLNGVFSFVSADEKSRVENSTSINLTQAAVLKRNEEGALLAAWVGNLAALSSTEDLQFSPISKMGEPWSGSTTLQVSRLIDDLWGKLDPYLIVDEDGVQTVSIKTIKERMPEMESKWSEFLRLVNQIPTDVEVAEIEERQITYNEYKLILRQLDESKKINVSALFQQVLQHLALAKGEVRLIGVTDEQVGNNVFQPAATQTQQQTLVVVHLKRPPLPEARPDANAIEDFGGNSNLDWEEEELEAEAFLEELEEENDEEE